MLTEAQASVCVQRHFLHRDNICRAFIGCTHTTGICRMLEKINKYEKRDKWEGTFVSDGLFPFVDVGQV